jgi:phospholipid/cholesterol/gamma-HCH transport system substrate-binding protein
MNAAKENFLLKGYFNRKEKAAEKAAEAAAEKATQDSLAIKEGEQKVIEDKKK